MRNLYWWILTFYPCRKAFICAHIAEAPSTQTLMQFLQWIPWVVKNWLIMQKISSSVVRFGSSLQNKYSLVMKSSSTIRTTLNSCAFLLMSFVSLI